MTETILLTREGQRLCAADPVSAEIIAAIGHKEYVTAEIKRARNPKHHAKLFVLLTEVWRNQEFYLTVGDMLDDLKIAVGYYRKVPSTTDPRGYREVPKSISYANMGQDKFDKFYNKIVDFIILKILPGVNQEELEQRVMDILGEDYA